MLRPAAVALVVKAWDNLPAPIKAGIKALIDSSPRKAGK